MKNLLAGESSEAHVRVDRPVFFAFVSSDRKKKALFGKRNAKPRE